MNKNCDTYITISEQAILYNARYFIKKSGKKLIAVIKSNAYGHGMVLCAKILSGVADSFAVASLDEAIELRESGIIEPILILNPVNIQFIQEAITYQFMVTISSLVDLQELGDAIHSPIDIQIKVDSGMNRYGVKSPNEYMEMVDYAKNHPFLHLVGVYTHFHTPTNREASKAQIDTFNAFMKLREVPFEYVHICSSNAVLNDLDQAYTTHVRIGIGLYGLCDSPDLLPVLSMYSKIVLAKTLAPGETVSYGANYQATENECIGVIPVGYYDGILRANVGREVYVDGSNCEILGCICMNSLMIRIPSMDIKKEVELIGPHIPVQKISHHVHTITYEIVTCLERDILRIPI